MVTEIKRYLESYIESLRVEKGLTQNSITAYAQDLKDFLRHSNISRVVDLEFKVLQGYADFLSPLKISSRQRKMTALRQFCKFLVREGGCLEDPTEGFAALKKMKSLPKVVSEGDVTSLLSIVNQLTDPHGIRMNALLSVLYSTGMRVSELVSLPFSASPFRNETHDRYLRFFGKGRKERVCPLTSSALDALKAYLGVRNHFVSSQAGEKWLFPSDSRVGHLTRQGFAKQLKKMAVVAGLPPETLSPHTLRHAFATHLLRRGADLRSLQKLLGHAHITTTEIYTHVNDTEMRDTLLRSHPLQLHKKKNHDK